MDEDHGTALEHQIRSQPSEIERMLSSSGPREQVHLATEGLHRARRLWVVGTGTSLHAAELGAAMLHGSRACGRRRTGDAVRDRRRP